VVFLTTQYLDEAEKLADRIAILLRADYRRRDASRNSKLFRPPGLNMWKSSRRWRNIPAHQRKKLGKKEEKCNESEYFSVT
jgi:ABC-type multidrug transport system ATPase subunit